MPRVLNKKTDRIPEDAVYVGRPTVFGNPFLMHGESDRDRVCDAYEEHIYLHREICERVKRELRGKDLVCFCAPKRCHADTLLRIANED
jgi:hypothetical protein